MLLRNILLLIALVLLARAIGRFLIGMMQGAAGTPRAGQRPPAPVATKMTQDPICGTYVVPGRAIALTVAGHSTYFCSERCRDQWAERASR